MAGGVIATGVTDPDFYSHQASRLGGAISSIVGGWRQQQEEKAAQDQAEINRAFQMMNQAPELADTWGPALVKKYGATHPEVPAMVSVYQNRKVLAKEIPDAGAAWEAAVQKKKDDHAAALAAAQAMPDYVDNPTPSGMFQAGQNGAVLVNPQALVSENAAKKAELARLAQVDPAYFSGQALDSLPVHQADQARLYAKERGIPIQQASPFDRYKDLPPRDRGLEAVRSGLIPAGSDTAESLRAGAKLESSTADLQKQQFQHDERLGRESHVDRNLTERNAAAVSRMTLAERIGKEREDRALVDKKALIDYGVANRVTREGREKDDPNALTSKDIVAGSRSQAKDYDELRKTALTGVAGEDRAAVLQKFEQDHGKRPHIITPYTAKQIMLMSEDEQDATNMAEELSAAVDEGHNEGVVLRAFKSTQDVLRQGGSRKPGGARLPSPDAPKIAPGKPVAGAAAKAVAKPAAAPTPEEEARAQARKMFPGLNASQIEEKVKRYLAQRHG